MPNALVKGSLFPPQLTNELISLTRGKSSVARLCDRKPISFVGNELFTFGLDSEANFVGERGAKTNGGATITPVEVKPYKVEYGFRTSDEFLYASEEYKINVLRDFNEAFSVKLARALDIGAMHGMNPRTGNVFADFGTNYIDSKVTQTINATADANADMESVTALVLDNEHEVTGIAMAPAFMTKLSRITKSDGTPFYPELIWGNVPDTMNGYIVSKNNTVSFNNSGDEVIVGNFRDFFRWGIAKDVTIEIIRYGNPDNSADGDLAGHNEVFIRAEAYIGWGVLVPDAFARIVNP